LEHTDLPDARLYVLALPRGGGGDDDRLADDLGDAVDRVFVEPVDGLVLGEIPRLMNTEQAVRPPGGDPGPLAGVERGNDPHSPLSMKRGMIAIGGGVSVVE